MIINVECTIVYSMKKNIAGNAPLKGVFTQEVMKMGLTPDQKIDLAIAYINKCDDFKLLAAVSVALQKRIDKLLEEVLS